MRYLSSDMNRKGTTDIIIVFEKEAKNIDKSYSILGDPKTAVLQTIQINDISLEEEREKFKIREEKALSKYNKWLKEYESR